MHGMLPSVIHTNIQYDKVPYEKRHLLYDLRDPHQRMGSSLTSPSSTPESVCPGAFRRDGWAPNTRGRCIITFQEQLMLPLHTSVQSRRPVLKAVHQCKKPQCLRFVYQDSPPKPSPRGPEAGRALIRDWVRLQVGMGSEVQQRHAPDAVTLPLGFQRVPGVPVFEDCCFWRSKQAKIFSKGANAQWCYTI